MRPDGWRAVDAAEARLLLAKARRLPMEQTWAYNEALGAAGGARVSYWAAPDLAVACIIERRWWALWPVSEVLRGPVWLQDDLDRPARCSLAAGLLRQALPRRRFGLAFWTADGVDAGDAAAVATADGMRKTFTGHATVTLPVLPPSLQRARLDVKWRNALVTGETRARLTIKVTRAPRAVLEVVSRYDALRRARGFSGPSGAMLRAFVERLASNSFFVVVAERDGSPEAGGLFVRHGDDATWVAGWAGDLARGEGGHRRILWRALDELRRTGAGMLDLGGIDTRAAAGIARFKLGMGGDVTRLPGTWGR